MNIRDLITKAKAFATKVEGAIVTTLQNLEGKVTTGATALIPWVSTMVDEIAGAATKISTDIPVLTSALEGPIGTAIAAAIPGGTVLKAESIAMINRFAPYIQKASDVSIMSALKLRLTAEIYFIEHGAVADISVAILDVQNFFQTAEGALDIVLPA